MPPESSCPNLPVTKSAVEYVEPGGWMIRNCLTTEQQIELYRDILKYSEESEAQREMTKLPTNKPYGITYYRTVLTNGSNCEKPQKWLDWAEKVWNLLNDSSEETGFPKQENYYFNSFYAQLFHVETNMTVHKDLYVDWGVSISLGASCDFVFDDKVIVLHSGDVFVADFSKVDHGVPRLKADNVPFWWNDDYKDNKSDVPIKTFGRLRCSVQIRYVPEDNPTRMTEEEFKAVIQSYKD